MLSIDELPSSALVPIGEENFRALIDNKLLFVDKTLLIKEFLDRRNAKVTLITRPRRFGKTLNLSMLHHFFAEKVDNKSTKGLFDGLKISEVGGPYMAEQGQYSVIFLTFKEVQSENFPEMISELKELMEDLYDIHSYLLDSPHLTKSQKKYFQAVLDQEITDVQLKKALFKLTKYLYAHYQKEVIVLIDEYDTPIQASYFNNYYEKAIKTMRGLLGSCLKTNRYLERALLTGITRVSKESLFSGLNNLKVCSLLDRKYQDHFGFTEEEVNTLAKEMNYQEKLADMKAWYNGYEVGGTTLYNPWSIVNCLSKKGRVKNYWLNTSGNELIKKLLIHSSLNFKQDFECLLRGETIHKSIREDMVFGNLDTDESLIWSLFFVSGYLKIVEKLEDNKKHRVGIYCALSIPNEEIYEYYCLLIQEWLGGKKGADWCVIFLEDLLAGRVNDFQLEYVEEHLKNDI